MNRELLRSYGITSSSLRTRLGLGDNEISRIMNGKSGKMNALMVIFLIREKTPLTEDTVRMFAQRLQGSDEWLDRWTKLRVFLELITKAPENP